MIDGFVLQKEGFIFDEFKPQSDLNRIRETLLQLNGLETVDFADDRIIVGYYQELISKSSVRSEIELLGGKVESEKKNRNPFKRFVDRLIESNEKSFGTEPLNCCKLNNQR